MASSTLTKSLDWGSKNVSLDGVANGIAQGDIGVAFAIVKSRDTFAPTISWQGVITGAPTTIEVDLEGSNDNVNWNQLAKVIVATSPFMVEVASVSPRYIRSHIITLTGGASPTVADSYQV